MPQDFIMKSNPELDKAVSQSTSHVELRERLLAAMANQGLVSRDREGVRATGQPQSDPVASSSGQAYPFEKEIHFHPSTGKRSLVIRATTLADLMALERQVTE
jgi:hypothetical protein